MEENTQDRIDLRDYLRVVLKRKWTIITVFAVTVITVMIHAFTATPIYKATTRLIIDKENPNVVSIQEVMAVDASGTDYYQTQYKIIESRSVAAEVVRRLRLDQNEEFSPKPKDDLISNITRSISQAFTSLKNSVFSLFRTEKPSSEGPEQEEVDNKLVSAFINRIEVTPIRNSRLVDISFEATDPALAAKIANSLAAAFIDQNLDTKLRAVQDAVKWLHSRIEEERKKVEKAEQALLKYKEKHDIITDFSSDVEKVTAQKLAQLNTQVVEAESKRVEAETRYQQAAALSGAPDMLDSIPEVLNNDLIRQIKAMEVDLYKRMSELSKKYGEQHPQMQAIESELKTLQKRKGQEITRVINSLRSEYKVAEAREKSLKASLEKQKRESLDLNQKAIEYTVLQREAESAKQMYELLIKRFKETSLTEDMRTGNIRIIDRAQVPKTPVRPKKALNILLAVLLGMISGVGLSFFFEYLDNTIKLPEDIQRYLHVPYLGPVPAMVMNGNPETREKPELATLHSPKSTASEAYRGIRTGILFSSAEKQPQVLLISSAAPQEGKTSTALNLAISMAQAGGKTVLLDCDMRKPSLHKILGYPRDKGLSSILVGNCELRDALITTQVPNLDIIPCGPIPPNPSEILGSPKMSKLIEFLRKSYSKIIIDSPPITAVTDAVVLGRLVDGTVLVIRAGDTPREIVKNGLSQLKGVNSPILGAVLNGVDMDRDGYYYYQYYYYYYGEDGERKKKVHKTKKRSHSKELQPS
ncbi:MAG: polysaccharide biosynthesis tyrosine autokinase [Desulfobacterota bacterium]|jgi:capsular exopolysaccharide synthesis family protein|nr:polysaccharide biosynthesis tyrosine autokinase [Thermodesulfobacteriota bacterium]